MAWRCSINYQGPRQPQGSWEIAHDCSWDLSTSRSGTSGNRTGYRRSSSGLAPWRDWTRASHICQLPLWEIGAYSTTYISFSSMHTSCHPCFNSDSIVNSRQRRITKRFNYNCAGISCWTQIRALLILLRSANDQTFIMWCIYYLNTFDTISFHGSYQKFGSFINNIYYILFNIWITILDIWNNYDIYAYT